MQTIIIGGAFAVNFWALNQIHNYSGTYKQIPQLFCEAQFLSFILNYYFSSCLMYKVFFTSFIENY
jgi:hypothetical protein